MSEVDLRKLDTIKGRKINHPHSAANIGFAIATMVFSLLPLLFMFVPSIANEPVTNGINILKFFGEALKGNITPTTDPSFDDQSTLLWIMYFVSAENKDFCFALMIILGSLQIVFMIFGVIKLIIGIVHVVKGYLKSTVSVPVIAAFELVFAILYFVILIVFYGWMKETSGVPDLVIWFTIIPVVFALAMLVLLGVLNYTHFSGAVLESEIEVEKSEQPAEKVVVQVAQEPKVRQVVNVQPDIKHIGFRAYAENQNLTTATIPTAVTKLGRSAFSNCLNLKSVYIPATITEIGTNCFFNCATLEKITYDGTKEQWSTIKRGTNWLTHAGTNQVVCTDGTIIVDPEK